MALNSLYCADVPLSNYSLIHITYIFYVHVLSRCDHSFITYIFQRGSPRGYYIVNFELGCTPPKNLSKWTVCNAKRTCMFFFWWHVLSMQDIHYSFTKSNSLRFAVLQNRSWSLIDDQTRWMQHLTAAAIHYMLIQQPVNCLGQRCALSLTTTTAIKHHTDHTQCHHHHHHHSITIGSCFNYRPSCRARFIRLRFDGHSTAYQRSLTSGSGSG